MKNHTVLPRASSSIFELSLHRISMSTARLLRRGAIAGALTLAGAPLLAGCDAPEPDSRTPSEGLDLPLDFNAAAGKADWAQSQGKRDTAMVSYLRSYWHEYRDCNTRGGCMGVDVVLKLRVKTVYGADLDQKRVGVVYRTLGDNTERTVLGNFYSSWDNGDEEWHVKVSRRAWEAGAFVFTTWYQDGLGHTFFDDNNGEFHAVASGGDYTMLRHDWMESEVTVTAEGVKGQVAVVLADLDYDKDVRLVWTTNNWETVNEFGMGEAGQTNVFHWSADMWSGYERWIADIDIDDTDAESFEYAVVYRHGVVNGADVYEFWDNNGGRNHHVARVSDPIDP